MSEVGALSQAQKGQSKICKRYPARFLKTTQKEISKHPKASSYARYDSRTTFSPIGNKKLETVTYSVLGNKEPMQEKLYCKKSQSANFVFQKSESHC